MDKIKILVVDDESRMRENPATGWRKAGNHIWL